MCNNSTTDENNSSRYSFGFKKKVIRQITNGQVSKHHASKKFQVPRSTINYWLEKWPTFKQREQVMNQNKKIEELEERIEELEAIKELQQDLIAQLEKITGQELAKKYLPKQLKNAIIKKKRNSRSD